MAAPGYPGAYPKGAVISGLEAASVEEGVLVFHAGTALNAAGVVVTAGGRVLGITGLGQDLPDALARAYRGVAHIRFEGQQYRRDIGLKGLARLAGS
jgi:phosphoribosylamine--glycine ligase